MPNAVFAVMSDMERCRAVLEAWESLGLYGVTILESVGLRGIQARHGQRDDLPFLPALRHLMAEQEYHHRTMFVVVDDDFDLEALIAATEQAVGGSLDAPNTGILFVVPVTHSRGIRPYAKRSGG